MGNESFDMDHYMTEAPIKKLLSKEISKKSNTRQSVPSVVARLMGVDMLPSDSKPASQVVDIKKANPTCKSMDMRPSRMGSSDCSRQQEVSFFERYGDENHVKLKKPKPREHPQEEELQKFRNEFEAWQAARLKEDLNRERVFLYSNPKRGAYEPNYKNGDVVEPRSYGSLGAHSNGFKLMDSVFGPTEIVILRPGLPDRIGTVSEDSWSTSEDGRGGGIESFLEEVKERLKLELQGRYPKRSTSIRGGGIETPYWEKPSDALPIIAQDRVKCLLRSNSMSERFQFMNDTAIRPRNVMEAARFSPSRHSMSNHVEIDVHASNNYRNDGLADRRRPDMSPKHLIRSLSAPVIGTSFGKLLLEDRHVYTGVHIRRKHEVIEKVSLNINKLKKDKFNIREKLSSFRYSLTLRWRLPFRRKVNSVEGSTYQSRSSLLRELTSPPTVVMSTLENSTEVPPSPASVCSSVQEEFWKQVDYLSPVSSSAVNHLEDSETPHVFNEINSSLNELRRKLDQFEGSFSEETIKEQLREEEEDAVIEDQTEAYIRDLLISAGLYNGVPLGKKCQSKSDPLGKLISSQVFEEVEESYNNENSKDDESRRENHKMILDLLNEVLPLLLREPVSLIKEAMLRPVHERPLCGRKLLSCVWSLIRDLADRSSYALDNILARDFRSTVWSELMDDNVNALARDMESQIIGDMIHDMVEDIVTI